MADMTLKLIVLALAASSALSSGPSHLPSFEYVVNGYNIVEGNPLSQLVGGDPGFSVHPIFQVSFKQNKTSDDERYFVPDNTSFNGDLSCVLSFNAVAQRSMVDYSQNLQSSVDTDFSGWGSAFSASESFNQAKKSIQNSSQKVITSSAACSVYYGAVDPLAPPFTPSFIALMGKLDEKSPPSDFEAYYDLIETYGTHYVDKVLMGAKYGYITSISESAWKDLESNGFGAKASANFHCMASISMNGMSSAQTVAGQQYSDAVSSKQVLSLGSRPPADDTAGGSLWAQQVFDQPFPIKYTLKPISNLLGGATVKANMITALAQYCLDRASKKHHGLSCTAPATTGCLWDSDCENGKQCVKDFCQQRANVWNGHWTGVGRWGDPVTVDFKDNGNMNFEDGKYAFTLTVQILDDRLWWGVWDDDAHSSMHCTLKDDGTAMCSWEGGGSPHYVTLTRSTTVSMTTVLV